MRNNLQVVISSKIVNRPSSTHCGVLKFRVKYHLITLSYQLGLFLMQVTATQVKQTYQKKMGRNLLALAAWKCRGVLASDVAGLGSSPVISSFCLQTLLPSVMLASLSPSNNLSLSK